MGLDVGAIVTGKVTGIKKFGAFITLDGGQNGLVHISEIANSYVSDVNDYLKDGQAVKVKVIAIDEGGRINLSIKKAAEATPVPSAREPRNYQPKPVANKTGDSFEDKLKQFLQDSNSKFSDTDLYSQNTARRRSRG